MKKLSLKTHYYIYERAFSISLVFSDNTRSWDHCVDIAAASRKLLPHGNLAFPEKAGKAIVS